MEPQGRFEEATVAIRQALTSVFVECLDVLSGKGPADLRDVTVELAAHMLVLGEQSSSISAARTMARKALQNGSALAKFP